MTWKRARKEIQISSLSTQTTSKQSPKIEPKSMKIWFWTSLVPFLLLPWSSKVAPRCQMVAQGTKMEVQMSIFGSRMELKWAGGRSFPSKENANGTLKLKSISFAWYNWCFLGGAITVSFTTPFTLQQLVPLQERMLIESSKLRNVSFAY